MEFVSSSYGKGEIFLESKNVYVFVVISKTNQIVLSNWATLNLSEKNLPLDMMNVQYAISLGIRTLSAMCV